MTTSTLPHIHQPAGIEADDGVQSSSSAAEPATDSGGTPSPSTSDYRKIAQAVGKRFSSLAGAGGLALLIAFGTASANCYELGERYAYAEGFGVPVGMVPYDLRDAILPAIGIGTAMVGAYAVFVLAMLFRQISRARRAAASPTARPGMWRRLCRRIDPAETATPSWIEKSMPFMVLAVLLAAWLTTSYEVGSWFGNHDAHAGKVLEVLDDPKLCPPRPAGPHESCVIVAAKDGTTLTRWIDAETGLFGAVTRTCPQDGDCYDGTETQFLVVNPRSPAIAAR